MADNSTQTGADTISTDDLTNLNGGAVSGVKMQRVKPSWGSDGVARDVDVTYPLPVDTNAKQLATYIASTAGLASGVLTANTAKPVLSLEHAASATKTVRVRRIIVSGIQTTSLAGRIDFTITRGTAASTGGTGTTPAPAVPGTAAAETTAKTLPTITAATQLLAITTAIVAAAANTGAAGVIIYDWQDSGQAQPLTLRAGNLDSLVVNALSSAAMNLTMSLTVIFTEE